MVSRERSREAAHALASTARRLRTTPYLDHPELLANVPIRVVAATHDTSVVMIERTYSAFIADHADAVARPALLELV